MNLQNALSKLSKKELEKIRKATKKEINQEINQILKDKESKKEKPIKKQSSKKQLIHIEFDKTNCGDKSCTKCPHGPYAYAYKYNQEEGKTKNIYVEKVEPTETTQEIKDAAEAKIHEKWPNLDNKDLEIIITTDQKNKLENWRQKP